MPYVLEGTLKVGFCFEQTQPLAVLVQAFGVWSILWFFKLVRLFELHQIPMYFSELVA